MYPGTRVVYVGNFNKRYYLFYVYIYVCMYIMYVLHLNILNMLLCSTVQYSTSNVEVCGVMPKF